MFQTLDEQIDIAVGNHPTTGKRLVRFASMGVIALAVFAGLYYLLMALE